MSNLMKDAGGVVVILVIVMIVGWLILKIVEMIQKRNERIAQEDSEAKLRGLLALGLRISHEFYALGGGTIYFYQDDEVGFQRSTEYMDKVTWYGDYPSFATFVRENASHDFMLEGTLSGAQQTEYITAKS